MCVILNVLSVLGVLYILEALNKHAYKILPKLTIDNGNFFDRKLGIKQITSLKEYIMVKVAIQRKLRKICSLKNEDISDFDIGALQELKYYINDEVRQYLNSLMFSKTSRIHKVSSHIQCELKYGKLDFYLSRNNLLPDFITIRYQSFSKDRPVLEVSNFKNLASYTYKLRDKYFRFIDPNINIINDIKDLINGLNANQKMQLQAA